MIALIINDTTIGIYFYEKFSLSNVGQVGVSIFSLLVYSLLEIVDLDSQLTDSAWGRWISFTVALHRGDHTASKPQ